MDLKNQIQKRKLKFRIWDRQAKAWAENDCSLHCFSNWQIDPFTGQLTDFVGAIDGDRETRYNANPAPNYYFRGSKIVSEPRYVLVQFTGMKDKDGKDIYEGDILKYDLGFGPIYWSVYMDTKKGMWRITKENGGNTGGWFNQYEVIGNIYENPELLKQ